MEILCTRLARSPGLYFLKKETGRERILEKKAAWEITVSRRLIRAMKRFLHALTMAEARDVPNRKMPTGKIRLAWPEGMTIVNAK